MDTTCYIDAEKVIKVVNKMDNLKFVKLELGDGSYIIIDIEYTDMDPEAKASGYIFVKMKQYVAAEVLEKAKIKFSRTSADVVDFNLLRLTIYPPHNTVFGID
ncbi:hypothetical protein [Pontibacter fetidus]|uniref:Uncharacterized protein n=1 Tax=Pontibacter fetidus TaxID=2700082 RepID=A0A6B2HCA9_9BACT|nr:hypothetical protein [Pontibacter fetidus]NDK57682.1 hypothetical protein [Pontibacter fetidus]